MKMKVLLVIPFLFLVSIAISQGSWGIVLGVNNAKFYNVKTLNSIAFSSKSGFIGGIIYDAGINSKCALQLEFKYAQMGSGESGSFGYDGSENLDYLTFGMILKIRLSASSPNFNLLLGTRVGYGFGDITAELNGRTNSSTYENVGANRFDYGGEFGIRAAYSIKSAGTLFIDVKEYLGFQNIKTESPLEIGQNMALSINFGYLFGFVKSSDSTAPTLSH